MIQCKLWKKNSCLQWPWCTLQFTDLCKFTWPTDTLLENTVIKSVNTDGTNRDPICNLRRSNTALEFVLRYHRWLFPNLFKGLWLESKLMPQQPKSQLPWEITPLEWSSLKICMAFNKPLQHFSPDDVQVVIAKIKLDRCFGKIASLALL